MCRTATRLYRDCAHPVVRIFECPNARWQAGNTGVLAFCAVPLLSTSSMGPPQKVRFDGIQGYCEYCRPEHAALERNPAESMTTMLYLSASSSRPAALPYIAFGGLSTTLPSLLGFKGLAADPNPLNPLINFPVLAIKPDWTRSQGFNLGNIRGVISEGPKGVLEILSNLKLNGGFSDQDRSQMENAIRLGRTDSLKSLSEAFERRGVPTTAFEAFQVCIQTRLGLQDKAEPAQQEDRAQTTINEPTTAQLLSSEPLRSPFDDPYQKGVNTDTDNGEVAVSPLPDGSAGSGEGSFRGVEGDDNAFDMNLLDDVLTGPNNNLKQRLPILPIQQLQQTSPVDQPQHIPSPHAITTGRGSQEEQTLINNLSKPSPLDPEHIQGLQPQLIAGNQLQGFKHQPMIPSSQSPQISSSPEMRLGIGSTTPLAPPDITETSQKSGTSRKLRGQSENPAKRSRHNPTTPPRLRELLPGPPRPRQAGNASFPTQRSQHLPANGYAESYTSQPKASSAVFRQAIGSFDAQFWNPQASLNDSRLALAGQHCASFQMMGQQQPLSNKHVHHCNPQPQAFSIHPPQAPGSIQAQSFNPQPMRISPHVAHASQPRALFQMQGQQQPPSNNYAQLQTLAPQSTPQDKKEGEWMHLPESQQLGETVGTAVLPCVVANAGFFQNKDEKQAAWNWLTRAWEFYWHQASGTPSRAAVAWDILSFTRNYRHLYVTFVDPCPLFDDGQARVCHEQRVCARDLFRPSALMDSVRPSVGATMTGHNPTPAPM